MPFFDWSGEHLWVSALLAAVVLGSTALAAGHAVLHKRDVRATIGWVALILAYPLVGASIYLVFGVNRIRRRAKAIRSGRGEVVEEPAGGLEWAAMPPSRFAPIAFLVAQVVDRPLLRGHEVEPLVDGEAAFSAMLEAIGGAERSITLATYIFDLDPLGERFVEALAAAHQRGVATRVLVDAVGERYSRYPATRALRRRGVSAARFLPSMAPFRWPFANLRNHRKLLVTDGATAFLGGMNLRQGHLVESPAEHRIQDVHFRVRGPVVTDLQKVFAGDWRFATGEELTGAPWIGSPEPVGQALARVIPDGPDEDLGKARWTMLGALASARHRVRIVTPYFLPDTDLETALAVTAMRGVHVEILIPSVNNLPWVHWASLALLAPLLEAGCRISLTPPPFDHTKLMVVDSGWTLLGSANWDPRSLRLNFELNLEVYDETLAESLLALVAAKRSDARELDLATLRSLPFGQRLRNGVARLAQPYL